MRGGRWPLPRSDSWLCRPLSSGKSHTLICERRVTTASPPAWCDKGHSAGRGRSVRLTHSWSHSQDTPGPPVLVTGGPQRGCCVEVGRGYRGALPGILALLLFAGLYPPASPPPGRHCGPRSRPQGTPTAHGQPWARGTGTPSARWSIVRKLNPGGRTAVAPQDLGPSPGGAGGLSARPSKWLHAER